MVHVHRFTIDKWNEIRKEEEYACDGCNLEKEN